MSDVSDVTEDKIELSQHQTRNWILVGVIAVLLLLVQGFFTYVIITTGTEMRETNHNVVDLVTTVKLQQMRQDNQQTEINALKDAKKEAGVVHGSYETRLNSIELRLALHDQWINSHKFK